MKKLIFDFIEKNKISERDAKSDSKDRRQENRYDSRNLEYIQCGKTLFVNGRREKTLRVAERKGKGKGCDLNMGQMQAESARLRTLMCLSGFRRMG